MTALTAREILNNVNDAIKQAEEYKAMFCRNPKLYISDVYEKLSIFDWWNETLSVSQLKQMKKFLETVILLGFDGYACFKVGAKYCSHGMWAYREKSTDGYSPNGDCIFHSFRSGDNYWDAELNGEWLHDKYATEENNCPDFTLKQIKNELLEIA